MEALLPLIIQAVGGIAGGYGASSVLKQLGIGMLTKVLGGAVGGVGLSNILGMVLPALAANPGAATSLSGILTNGVGGAAGGAVLTSVIGLVMKAMNKA